MTKLVWIAMVALLTALMTWFAGWIGVVIIAVIFGAAANGHFAPWLTAVGAALGWAVLLVLDASHGAFVPLAHSLGGVLRAPWPVVVLVALLLAFVLAWGAATVAEQGKALFTRNGAGERA